MVKEWNVRGVRLTSYSGLCRIKLIPFKAAFLAAKHENKCKKQPTLLRCQCPLGNTKLKMVGMVVTPTKIGLHGIIIRLQSINICNK